MTAVDRLPLYEIEKICDESLIRSATNLGEIR